MKARVKGHRGHANKQDPEGQQWKVESPGFQRLLASTTVRMITRKNLQDPTCSSHPSSTGGVLGTWLRALCL